jgi:hypothetical protein
MVLKNIIWRYRLDSFVSEYGPVTGPSEHGNERSGPIKDVEFVAN